MSTTARRDVIGSNAVNLLSDHRASAIVLGSLLLAASAFAHPTYNLAGNTGPGIAGSTPPGATNDGAPTDNPSTWTNGLVDGYAGALPVNWYAGMHSRAVTRNIQSGLAPNPPSGSLLEQVFSFNAVSDPDIPTDRVIAVGGLSWADPGNDGQGWGMGLDYGLLQFSPVVELLADGAVRFTVTLSDDPSDGVATQLAFALYGGWDTSNNASRHQSFITNPTPVDDPLGSAGLTLIDFAVASAPGETLSRTYPLTVAHDGKYTVIVGALGGVSGQYQLIAAAYPDVELTECESGSSTQLAACNAALADAQGQLAAATADADADGVRDSIDQCATTPSGAPVDPSGCSQSQFCASVDVSSKRGRKLCAKSDWKNDEPTLSSKTRDCGFDKEAKACAPML